MSTIYEIKYEPNKAIFSYRKPEYIKAIKEKDIELQKQIEFEFDELGMAIDDVIRAYRKAKNKDLRKS
jgi:hypothetical protein